MKKLTFGFVLVLLTAFVFLTLPASAQTTADVVQSATWTVYEAAVGVTIKTCHFDDLFGGQQDVYLAEADMTTPGVSLKFMGMADGTRKVVSNWASESPKAAAVINGTWFNVEDGMPIQFLRIAGVNLAKTLPEAQERGGIVISSSGEVFCLPCPETGWPSLPHPNVMASEVPSVVNGQPYPWTDPNAPDSKYYYVNRAPRTCIGITANRRVLLVIIDGRRPPSAIGMTYANVADLMIALGAQNATVLDGGGSSTLWAQGYGVMNVPSDGRERKVAMALCLDAQAILKPYKAEILSVTCASRMVRGATQSVTFQFRNVGTKPWNGNVRLATTGPRNRKSAFESPSWIAPNRPCSAEEKSVAPGEIGTFTFDITAPSLPAMQMLVERFGLIEEPAGWFGREDNRLSVTVYPQGEEAGSDVVIEARPGGKNGLWYYESGEWADSPTSCSAPDTTPGIGMRFGSTYRSKAGLKIAIYRPVLSVAGNYEVSVAWGADSGRKNPVTYKVTDTKGTQKYLLDQESKANEWFSLGVHSFDAGSGGVVEISNENIDVSGSMYAAAVRFKLVPGE